MPRKLEAQFDGRYLMSSVLMTSTMKSEPGTPPIRFCGSCGVPVSAAIWRAVGGRADGARADAAPAAGIALAAGGATVVAAPVTATPARNLRRSTFKPESLRAIFRSL